MAEDASISGGSPGAEDELLRIAQRILQRALDLPESDRLAFLEAECAGNSELRDCTLCLLAAFDPPSAETRPVAPRLPSSPPLPEFIGNSRFVVERQLGCGSFGTVFQVWDREQRTSVALKVLQSWKADALYRFKNEFRSLVKVHHRNLVELYELFSEADLWFFTMELVGGPNFLEYARPLAKQDRWEQLREALSQLMAGVYALHLSRQIHRDLKPENVLLTKNGRVVVLDFGLVREIGGAATKRSLSVVGTPDYMSPEQLENRELSPGSDWYSVGLILYETLCGSLPYDRSTPLWTRGSTVIDAPCGLNPEIPPDLNDLCLGLLNERPEKRTEAAVAFITKGATAAEQAILQSQHRQTDELFLGRDAELQQLNEAFSQTESGQLSIVLIEGVSGIGKTTLVRRFLSLLRQQHPNVLTFKGRCYEFEATPYKGIDALVDELSVFLESIDQSEIQSLLPLDAALLPKLFPVLGRVRAIAQSPVRAVVPDEQELRQRTFSALRELFVRIANRHPLVLWIDDLQWADRDSGNLLAELCTPPLEPAVLVLLSYRSEELSSNPTLQYISNFIFRSELSPNSRRISLLSLNEAESRQLIMSLTPQNTTPRLLQTILAEARGHPLFLRELAQFAKYSYGDSFDGQSRELTLRSMLQDRVRQLASPARELLELIALAVQPLPQNVLYDALTSGAVEARSRVLQLLVSENLARITGTPPTKILEPFHDQVRSAVLDMLPADTLRSRHAQLANALAAQTGVEPQLLVTHFREAGNLQAAYESALKAADAAEGQLAFDRAAVFIDSAISIKDVEPTERLLLYRRLAEALRKAGRGRDAAIAYQKCFGLTANKDYEMLRLAAEQLMRSGYLDEGMQLFTDLAKKMHIRVPTSPTQAVGLIALARVRTRARLLFGPPAPAPATAPAEAIAQMDVLRTGATILNTADPVLAAYFQVVYVQKALQVREPSHLSIALALEATIREATGTRNLRACQLLKEHAERVAADAGNANVQGIVQVCRIYSHFLLARIRQGIRESQDVIDYLRTKCDGVAWELTTCYTLRFWFECWAGNVREVSNLLPQLLKDGAARGDVNVEASLRLISSVHYVYLSQDEPDRFLSESEQVLGRWSSKGFHLQHYGANYTRSETYLYLGAYDKAREVLLSSWDKMSKSFILRWQILRVMVFFLRARAALGCWLSNRSDHALYSEVEYYAKHLQRSTLEWCRPMACMLRAGLASGSGRPAEALQLLDEAQEDFEKVPLHAFAAAIRHVSGSLKSGASGQMQIKSAKEFFVSQNVRDPESFIRMLVPGKWGN